MGHHNDKLTPLCSLRFASGDGPGNIGSLAVGGLFLIVRITQVVYFKAVENTSERNREDGEAFDN